MKQSALKLALLVVIIQACNSKVDKRSATPVDLKKGFATNIEADVQDNNKYRKVLYTGECMQLVLMSLKPGEEIGEEIHEDTDQFFRFESGTGKCIINAAEYKVGDGDVVIIPAGARHNVINTDSVRDLKMYTLYAPPHHQDGIIRDTKKDAENNDEEFDGKTTE